MVGKADFALINMSVLACFNAIHQSVQFEMEEGKEGTLNILDLSITVHNERLKIEFYRKQARTDMFINAKSALPTTQKIQIIKNERQRIIKRCESFTEAEKHLNTMDERLLKNGFNESLIKKFRKRKREKRGESLAYYNKEPFFFSGPYVSCFANQVCV